MESLAALPLGCVAHLCPLMCGLSVLVLVAFTPAHGFCIYVLQCTFWHNGTAAPAVGGRLHLTVAYGSDNDKIYNTMEDKWER